MSIGFAALVWMYENQRIVKASQPLFLYFICFGTFIMGLSIFPLAVDDAIASDQGCNAACIAFPWLLVIGFSSAFAALFSKIWRINKIFTAAASFKRIKVNTKDVMIPFVVLISLNIILLLCWSIIDPPVYQRIKVSDSYSFGTCWYNWTLASKIIVSIIVVLNVSAVIVGNVQAYRTRHVADELSESKYITLIMASILQVLIVSAPLFFLVIENPKAFFFVVSTMILIIASSLLLLIFIPKIFSALKAEKNGNKQEQSFGRRRRNSSSRRKFLSFSLGGSISGSRRESDGVDGLRIISTSDATTLKKELDGYKYQLEEAKALLHRNGLNIESKTSSNVPLKIKEENQRQVSVGRIKFPLLM